MYRHLGWLLSGKDTIDVPRNLSEELVRVPRIGTVRYEPTGDDKIAPRIDCRKALSCDQLDEFISTRIRDSIREKNQTAVGRAPEVDNGGFDVRAASVGSDDPLDGE